MYLLLHLFAPLLVVETLCYVRPQWNHKFVRFPLLIGSVLPDIIDKPLMLLDPNFFSGRGFAHAPLFWVTLMGVFLLFRVDRAWILSLSVGISFHLLLDIPHIPWFWPFVPYAHATATLAEWFHNLITNPFNLISEICSFIGLITIFKVKNVLFTPKFVDFPQLMEYLGLARFVKTQKNIITNSTSDHIENK